jgi:RNA polymerase sigma factor (TIGR02999 family)
VAKVEQNDIIKMLAAWAEGNEDALDRQISVLYPELRRIARQHLGRRPGESLESAALANEVYLKLIGAGTIQCESRTHFLALCAQMSRRLLVDHARRGRSAKRGGDALQVPLDEELLQAEAGGIEVVALDRALEALAAIDGRKSRLVELRYFGGLSVEEAAGVLGVSKETAKRAWRMARAWLYAELAGEQKPIKKPAPMSTSRPRRSSSR